MPPEKKKDEKKGKKEKKPAPRPTILVVDDTGMVRQTLIRILRLGQFPTLEAGGAEEAVRVLATHPVDLILMDVNMPGVDGISLTAKLKQTEKFKDIPIIMCTAMNEMSFVMQAKKAGACDYIVKPFEPALVLQKVIKTLERVRPGCAAMPAKKEPAADESE